jgi:hypothetical protein
MAQDDAIQMEFDITEDDLVRANRAILSSTLPLRRERRLVWSACVSVLALVVVVVILMATSDTPFNPLRHWPLSLLALAIPLLLLWYALHRRHLPARLVRKSLAAGHGRTTIGRWTFSVDPEGIAYSGPFGDIRLVWRNISKLAVTDEFVLFHLRPLIAIPVPRSAFRDEAEFRDFAETAARYREAAPAFEPKCPKCGYDLTGATAGGCPECGWRREE